MNTRESRFKEKQETIKKEEQTEKHKKLAKRILLGFFILFLCFALLMTYITTIGTTSLVIHEEKITNSRLPSSFHGLKVIVFSDLHYKSTFLKKHLENLKEEINVRKPDLIFFTGDLLNSEKALTKKDASDLQTFLNELDANLGKYAVLGETDTDEAKEMLTLANFQVLENTYDLIYQKDANPILLMGLDTRSTPDYEKTLAYFNEANANQEIFTIALLHHPDYISMLLESKAIDYAFAGHSHNGQIRLFDLPPLKKLENAEEYYNMHYEINNTNLYISPGLGTSNNPYRFCARPSIFFFRFTTS